MKFQGGLDAGDDEDEEGIEDDEGEEEEDDDDVNEVERNVNKKFFLIY